MYYQGFLFLVYIEHLQASSRGHLNQLGLATNITMFFTLQVLEILDNPEIFSPFLFIRDSNWTTQRPIVQQNYFSIMYPTVTMDASFKMEDIDIQTLENVKSTRDIRKYIGQFVRYY